MFTGGYCQVWEKVSIRDLTSSDIFVIVGKNSDKTYALPNDNRIFPKAIDITLTADGNYISSEVTNDLKWNKENYSGYYIFHPNGNKNSWLHCNKVMNFELGVGSYKRYKTFTLVSASGSVKIDRLLINGLSKYIDIDNKTEWCANSSTTTGISFYKYIPDALQPTTTSFGYYSKKKFTFNAGVPEKVVKPRATAKNDISQKNLSEHIIYSSSNSEIVTVDAKTGELTFTNTKFGTAYISARLIKTDSYKESYDYTP